jgi:DNA-binding NarL/FixJ family response regulator
MRVIIADDHRIVREGLRFMLSESSDVDIVAEAESGEELLDILSTTPTDVVLLDVRMPGMSGLDALEQLAASHPDVKVIILSMHDDPAYVRRAVELGASGYLLKSTGREELERALEIVFEGGAYVQGEVTKPLLDAMTGDIDEPPALSPREQQILQLVALGRENKQIARELDISEATVKTHIKGIFARLDVRSRAEAVAVGLRFGIIE